MCAAQVCHGMQQLRASTDQDLAVQQTNDDAQISKLYASDSTARRSKPIERTTVPLLTTTSTQILREAWVLQGSLSAALRPQGSKKSTLDKQRQAGLPIGARLHV